MGVSVSTGIFLPASSLTVSQIPDLLTQEKIKSNSVSSSSSRVSYIGALYFFDNSDCFCLLRIYIPLTLKVSGIKAAILK